MGLAIVYYSLMNNNSAKLIILGRTKEGKKFRPGDWAQRLTSAVASYGPGRRLIFHPKVTMSTQGDVNCVIVDNSLEDEEPILFDFLVNFGRENNLEIVNNYIAQPIAVEA